MRYADGTGRGAVVLVDSVVLLKQIHVVGNSLLCRWQISASQCWNQCLGGDGGRSGGAIGSVVGGNVQLGRLPVINIQISIFI